MNSVSMIKPMHEHHGNCCQTILPVEDHTHHEHLHEQVSLAVGHHVCGALCQHDALPELELAQAPMSAAGPMVAPMLERPLASRVEAKKDKEKSKKKKKQRLGMFSLLLSAQTV